MSRFILVICLATTEISCANGAVAQETKESAVAEQPEIHQAQQPTTTADPDIPADQLELLVKPLSKDELATEATAWFELLKAKTHELSGAQLGVKKTNEALDSADENVDEAAKAIEQADAVTTAAEKDAEEKEQQIIGQSKQASVGNVLVPDGSEPTGDAQQNMDPSQEPEPGTENVVDKAEKIKSQILTDINNLRTEQTALVDRLNVVLDAYEAKGGDPKEFRDYINVVTGIEVDVTDVTTTWSTIAGWMKSEEGGWRWGKNVLLFVTALVVSWLLSLIAGTVANRIAGRTPNVSNMARLFVVSFVRKAIFVIGAIVALAMLEIDIAPLLAALGAIGFIVGFALQGTLSNFASGLMILVYRPFDTGDLVEAGGTTGRIHQMNLVSTTFQTLDNQRIIVPNNAIWGSVIRNITANSTRRIDMMFGIGYSDDIGTAEAILCDILQEHPHVLNEPAPIVRVHELADSSVNFVCRPWVNTKNYWPVYWDVTRAVKERFEESGISIPFPQQDIHIHQVSGPSSNQ